MVLFAAGRARRRRIALPALARGGAALAVGLAAGAVQLLPTLRLAGATVRGQVSYAFLSGGFLPHELVGLLLPRGFDGATPLYLGVPALTLAVLGLGAGPADLRRFAAVLGALSLPLALGKYAALYPLLYLAAPGFAEVRDQERAVYLLTVAVALLAANGVQQALVRGGEALRPLLRLLAFALAAALAAGGAMSLALTTQLHWGLAAEVVDGLSVDREGLDWALLVTAALLVVLAVASSARRPATALAWPLVGLIAVDLLSAHAGDGTVPGRRDAYPLSPLIAAVQADADLPFRISSEGLLPAGGNAGLVYGLEDTTGGTPLELQLFHDAAQLPELQRERLLNVRYVFTKRASLGDQFRLVGRQGDVQLFQLLPGAALPRAWLVQRATAAPAAGLWPAVAAADLRTTAVLPAGIAAPALGSGQGEVRVAAAGAGTLRLAVRADGPGLLVISQVRYPGWQATLDGRPAALLPVDGALYGVAVGPGSHTLLLRFQPVAERWGAAISAAAGLLIVLGLGEPARLALRRGAAQRPAGAAEYVAPSVATITSATAASARGPSPSFSPTAPTSAATAGSKLMSTPKTRAGRRRSASSSSE